MEADGGADSVKGGAASGEGGATPADGVEATEQVSAATAAARARKQAARAPKPARAAMEEQRGAATKPARAAMEVQHGAATKPARAATGAARAISAEGAAVTDTACTALGATDGSTAASGRAASAAQACASRGGAPRNREGAAVMDSDTNFLLKIHLLGNHKKARKDCKCFSFEMVVDSDLSNYKDFIDSVTNKYPPGYLEVAYVQYYDNVLKNFPEVKSDQDLISMFDVHSKEKVVEMFVSYCDPSEKFEPITEWEFDVEEQPENNTEEDDDDYLRNPLPENEYVGVDEEIMYLDIVPVNAVHGAPVHAPGCSEKEKEKALAEDGSEDGSEEDEIEGDEDEPYEEVNHHPIADFDEVDPPMEVGTTYRSMYVFKLALCQHAIKHEFYYSIDKFRAAYSALIPAIPDKTQWPKSTHGFFMYGPLLVSVAGRHKTERYKGRSDKKGKKGQHQCPICREYGHHWQNCRKGSKEDIEAMKTLRGTPKKRKKITKTAQSSIVPLEDEAPTRSMTFPPSQNLEPEPTTSKKRKSVESNSGPAGSVSLEITSRKKGKQGSSNSGASKRSRSGSNQPEPLSIELPTSKDKPEAVVKLKDKRRKKEVDKNAAKNLLSQLDSPAMGTRSKKLQPTSPALSTRSKRRLSL